MEKTKSFFVFVSIVQLVFGMLFVGCGKAPDKTGEIEAERALVQEYRAFEAERSENIKNEQYREMMTEGIRAFRKDEVHYHNHNSNR